MTTPHEPAAADIHLQRLLAESIEEPWYRSVYRNLRDTIAPEKLPPLVVTSRPVNVADIWGLYGRRRQSGLMSLAVHGCAVTLLFTVVSNRTVQRTMKDARRLIVPDLSEYMPRAAPKAKKDGGGGGDESLEPASRGRAPKFALRQFVPPAAVINNPDPKLLLDPTLIGPPEVQLPSNNMAVWGDPMARLGPPSNGPGTGGGIGSGNGGGIGPGDGPGLGPGHGGGLTSNVYGPGGGVSAPTVRYKIEPEYSEEARKAKYSGTVLLLIEVDAGGRARNVKVTKGVGLGLDEKAIEAVNKWRFNPGLKDGKPVTVRAQVEVNFRLL